MIMLKENALTPMEKLYLVLDIRLKGIFLQPYITRAHLEHRML